MCGVNCTEDYTFAPVRVRLCNAPLHAMKVYEAKEAQIYSFLSSAVDECQWMAACLSCFTPEDRPRFAMGGFQSRSAFHEVEKNLYRLWENMNCFVS